MTSHVPPSPRRSNPSASANPFEGGLEPSAPSNPSSALQSPRRSGMPPQSPRRSGMPPANPLAPCPGSPDRASSAGSAASSVAPLVQPPSPMKADTPRSSTLYLRQRGSSSPTSSPYRCLFSTDQKVDDSSPTKRAHTAQSSVDDRTERSSWSSSGSAAQAPPPMEGKGSGVPAAVNNRKANSHGGNHQAKGEKYRSTPVPEPRSPRRLGADELERYSREQAELDQPVKRNAKPDGVQQSTRLSNRALDSPLDTQQLSTLNRQFSPERVAKCALVPPPSPMKCNTPQSAQVSSARLRQLLGSSPVRSPFRRLNYESENRSAFAWSPSSASASNCGHGLWSGLPPSPKDQAALPPKPVLPWSLNNPATSPEAQACLSPSGLEALESMLGPLKPLKVTKNPKRRDSRLKNASGGPTSDAGAAGSASAHCTGKASHSPTYTTSLAAAMLAAADAGEVVKRQSLMAIENSIQMAKLHSQVAAAGANQVTGKPSHVCSLSSLPPRHNQVQHCANTAQTVTGLQAVRATSTTDADISEISPPLCAPLPHQVGMHYPGLQISTAPHSLTHLSQGGTEEHTLPLFEASQQTGHSEISWGSCDGAELTESFPAHPTMVNEGAGVEKTPQLHPSMLYEELQLIKKEV
eukprot:gene12676-15906_t